MKDKQPLRLFALILPLSPCGRGGPKGRRGGRAALVALRLDLVRGISARKRAPHPLLKPSPVKGEGFLVHAEAQRSSGVIARVRVIPHRNSDVWRLSFYGAASAFTSRYSGGKGSAELDTIASDKGLESDEVLRYIRDSHAIRNSRWMTVTEFACD